MKKWKLSLEKIKSQEELKNLVYRVWRNNSIKNRQAMEDNFRNAFIFVAKNIPTFCHYYTEEILTEIGVNAHLNMKCYGDDDAGPGVQLSEYPITSGLTLLESEESRWNSYVLMCTSTSGASTPEERFNVYQDSYPGLHYVSQNLPYPNSTFSAMYGALICPPFLGARKTIFLAVSGGDKRKKIYDTLKNIQLQEQYGFEAEVILCQANSDTPDYKQWSEYVSETACDTTSVERIPKYGNWNCAAPIMLSCAMEHYFSMFKQSRGNDIKIMRDYVRRWNISEVSLLKNNKKWPIWRQAQSCDNCILYLPKLFSKFSENNIQEF